MRISDWSSDVCASDLGPVYMRRYGSDGAPLALAQKVSDRQSGIAEVPLDPGALVPLYAAAAVELRYAAMPPDTSIHASGATLAAWTAGFKLTPYLGLRAGARESTRLNSSHYCASGMPSTA